MVGPDPDEQERTSAPRWQHSHVEAEAGSWAAAVVATSAGAAAVGAFFASLALTHQVALENAALPPASNWLHSVRDWLPLLCIGFGLARLVASQLRARTAFRGLGIGAVCALASSMAWFGPGLPWLSSAVACVLGAVLGLHCESARRAGRSGVVIAGLVAAATAYTAIGLAPMLGVAGWCAADVLGVVLCAALIAFLLDAPPLARTAAFGKHWQWLLLGWLLVAVVGACAAVQSDAGQWVLLSAMIAVIVTAAAACRLALALGAAVATFLISSGLLGAALDAATRDAAIGAPANVVLQEAGAARAIYVRSTQELQLRLDGEVVAAAGPDRNEEPLLAAILHAVVHAGDRVLLLGGGTGRVGASLKRSGRCEIEAATAWPELAALQAAVAGDGPVQQPSDPNQVAAMPWQKALSSLPSNSRQVLVLGELPSRATTHRATDTFQRQLRRVAGDGLVCQPIALDRISSSALDRWFDVVAKVHAWNGIYAAGNAAVLVSAARKPTWRTGFAGWSNEARWALHEAHLIGPEDLEVAFLGTVKQRIAAAPTGRADRGVARQLLRRLAAPAVVPSGTQLSLLRRWQSRYDELARARSRLLTLSNDPAGRAQAQSIAARFLPTGAPAAWLQAALGLAGADDIALRNPSLASRCAYAMDPTFFETPAAVYESLPLPMQQRGDLEDLFRLEEGPGLVRRCSGSNPQAVALRARFPSRCARSLVAELSNGPLEESSFGDDAVLALRELADPFVLREIASVVVPLGRLGELLTYWRADLPLPAALLDVAKTGALADQRMLAAALRGRRDPSCYPAIAEFLVAADLELRRRAGEALAMSVGNRVPFDAHWPRSRRLDAATRLRDLHNRKP